MRVVEYERLGIDIKTLPISRLRAIDIQTGEEEKEIARLIAEKSQGTIPQGRVNIEDIKARMDKDLTQRTLTREKELEYQKEVDARVAMVMPPKAVAYDQPEPVIAEPIIEPVVETPLEDKLKKLKKK
jgi:hypothetical protein